MPTRMLQESRPQFSNVWWRMLTFGVVKAKQYFIGILLLFPVSTLCAQPKGSPVIHVEYVSQLNADFSFAEQWSYPEGVYRNRFGQLSCDGYCPIEVDAMKDSFGRVHEDSLEHFYALVDTTHLTHTFYTDTNSVYEWAGARHCSAHWDSSTHCIHLVSEFNAGTHSMLHIQLFEDSTATAWIEYISVRNIPRLSFPVTRGKVFRETNDDTKGMIKLTFDLQFRNTEDFDKKLFWKGKILVPTPSTSGN